MQVIQSHASRTGSGNNAKTTLAAAATTVSVRIGVQRDVGYGRSFVSISGSNVEWESGSNHVVPAPEADAAVSLNWGAAEAVVKKAEAGSPFASSPGPDPGTQGPASDDSPVRARWSGKEPVFMQGNEHSRERQGRWETEGLEGATLEIVNGDRDAGSWLQKLAVAEKLLVQSAPRLRPRLDAVAAAYVYLQWVGNGTLACAESGGHHRPNHHAELARSMFRSLEWVLAEGGKDGEAQALALLARRLQAYLPSFDAAYTASTPLTRIRDIAHRNDIPHELKQEIKHTIQNKLHRNAGPEDLVATEAMLRRITRHPGEYPDAFVGEFRRFHAELSDFFSAGSLTDSLAALRPSLGDDPSDIQIVERFLEAKRKLEAAGSSADMNDVVDTLHTLGTLRALLCSRLSSGLRNDVGDGVLAGRQRRAEIQAEDYAFVLLSRFSNLLESQGGAESLVQGKDGGWALPLGSLVLGLRQVGLGAGSGLARECAALEQELATWQRLGGFGERDNALRLKASLQRLRRLTHDFSQILMDSLSERAQKLGDALGVSGDISSVFTEAEIRASVVFQLSKLAATLLKGTELVAGGSPFDVVVGGEASGKLQEVDALQPGCAGVEACVLVVRSATGDEEVGALGPNLRGIILRHDIPHLSHLGVRARQEQVPFVLVEDDAFFEESIAPLLGKHVTLSSVSDATTLTSGAADAPGLTGKASRGRPEAGAPSWKGEAPRRISKLSASAAVVPLAEVEAGSCGSKAAACSRLSRLAVDSKGNSGSEFAAPPGVVLPFGTMELALEAGGHASAFRDLLSQLDDMLREPEDDPRNARLARLCEEVQGLILNSSKLPDEVIKALQDSLPADSPVIARSSANVEDLAGLSGAGLYDSIPGIDPSSATSLQRGIALVWASLFSRRAVLSRGAGGIPSQAAAMAVLLQPQLCPDLSFVLHTAHPVTRDAGVMWAEVAPGQGEILATGSRGAAWRMEIGKAGDTLRMLSFANFSTAWLVARGTGKGGVATLAPTTVDYSSQALSGSEEARAQLSRRLLGVGAALEAEMGGAQDVEGCIAAGQLYIVQTRPQP
ncbi:Phosphoglucan, water dikinase, chloroplastic [Auxenochlorella protothecoides]|uniref:Phosphoglucan, water dikinase, chloroplastic n=1 Tax=Auxenochlorella protothecoides TaxID=3075 RepID=A0A087SCX1_AUXPR|nr:Phosphoglucan, water dikinase, chloroplastic [Auxenochlorella protothecoides]KFM23575.1 Phosphoglucan, water dikinase, chloroplastic [Auxenochlorella protothecoides]